ncbi:MAG: hypothetical protein FJ164_03315 [Gammaproteobacteria bacterium]|nr:hypothetical protein [Gammaproteobacteria bacterium]
MRRVKRRIASSALVLLLTLLVMLAGCGEKGAEETQSSVEPQNAAPEALASKPGIKMQTVKSQGYGRSFDEALQQALVMAIKQVNGVSASQSVDTESIVSEYRAKSSSTGEYEGSGRVTASAESSAEVSLHSGSGADTAHLQSSASANAEATEDFKYSDSFSAEGKFDSGRTIVSMSSSVSGVVRRFQVASASQSKDKSSWTVAIVAEIPIYEASAAAKRMSVAVLPLRIESKGREGSGYEKVLRPLVIDALSQSNKLAVLDRDYQAENEGEIEQLNSDGFNKDQAARLGNRLGADYIIVGTITKAEVFTESKYIKAADKTIYGATHASAGLTFRLIEAATGIVQLSATLEGARYQSSALSDIAKTQAAELADRVLESLYPIRVEGFSNGQVYLGRGGDSIKVGDVFEVFRRGEAITDSDTGEIIGHSEENLGLIEVVEVQAKISKGTFLGGPPQDMSNPKSMVVRRSQSVPAAAAVNAGTSGQQVTATAAASAHATVTATNQGAAPRSAPPPADTAGDGPKEGVDF